MMARLRADPSIRAKVKKTEAEVADGRITPGAGGGADRGDAEVTMSDKLRILDHRLRPVSRRALQSDAAAGRAADAVAPSCSGRCRTVRPHLSGDLQRRRSPIAGAAGTEHRPHALLMFGLAARTPFVRIETRARNAVTTLWPDADHTQRAQGIDRRRRRRHDVRPAHRKTAARGARHRHRCAGLARCRQLSLQLSELARDRGDAAATTVRASPPSSMCRCSRATALRNARARATASRWKNWSMPAKRCCWRW